MKAPGWEKMIRPIVLVGFKLLFLPCASIFTFKFNFNFNRFLIKFGFYLDHTKWEMVARAKRDEEQNIFSSELIFLRSHEHHPSIPAKNGFIEKRTGQLELLDS